MEKWSLNSYQNAVIVEQNVQGPQNVITVLKVIKKVSTEESNFLSQFFTIFLFSNREIFLL